MIQKWKVEDLKHSILKCSYSRANSNILDKILIMY